MEQKLPFPESKTWKLLPPDILPDKGNLGNKNLIHPNSADSKSACKIMFLCHGTFCGVITKFHLNKTKHFYLIQKQNVEMLYTFFLSFSTYVF